MYIFIEKIPIDSRNRAPKGCSVSGVDMCTHAVDVLLFYVATVETLRGLVQG